MSAFTAETARESGKISRGQVEFSQCSAAVDFSIRRDHEKGDVLSRSFGEFGQIKIHAGGGDPGYQEPYFAFDLWLQEACLHLHFGQALCGGVDTPHTGKPRVKERLWPRRPCQAAPARQSSKGSSLVQSGWTEQGSSPALVAAAERLRQLHTSRTRPCCHAAEVPHGDRERQAVADRKVPPDHCQGEPPAW